MVRPKENIIFNIPPATPQAVTVGYIDFIIAIHKNLISPYAFPCFFAEKLISYK